MSKNFNNAMIAQSLADRFGFTKVKSAEIVYHLQELLQQELYRGYPVNLPMVGKFKAVLKAERKARNPKSGESVVAPAHYVLKFKTSSKMKAWLNKNR